MAEQGRIIVVEDDEAQLRFIKAVLEDDGWSVLATTGGAEALAALDRGEEADVVITDLMMPEMDGRQVLAAVQERRPEVPVIILTAHASVDSAVELLHAGAHHYLSKPTKVPELKIAVRRAVQATETGRELARLRRRVALPADVVGVSAAMQEVLETALRVAPTATPVLITGEPGTGKEVVARAVHGASGRAAFVSLNCAAVPPHQFEAELFGARRGGGADVHSGVVEVAAGGTVFLDEVTEVPLALQDRLLRLLQHGEYRRAGDPEPRRAAVRFIAASGRDPEEEVRAGRMLQELHYHLAIVHLHLPPLRERPVDIPALAQALLMRLADRYQLEHAELAPETLAALTAYRWPGNIRELETVLARALAVRSGRNIAPRDLPAAVAKGSPHGHSATHAPSPTLTLEEVERRHILAVMERTGGNKLKAAIVLGIDRSTLHRKLKSIQGLAALPL
jgi:DNA-binding NtrC family response regulator